jgi:hypothetical protein
MFRYLVTPQNINNGVLIGQKAMPQKDITSDGDSSFELGRQTYINTHPSTTPTVQQLQQKKWYGNRDASQVTANRRTNQIGVGSLNASSGQIGFTTYKDVNTVSNALTRVRAGGAVAPAKKAANKNNAPTPTFSPAIPMNNIRGIKYPVLYH